MFKKFNSEITLLNSVVLLILTFYFLFYHNDSNDIVFVDNTILFNEFKMTKELSKNGDLLVKNGKNHLDSLYVLLEGINVVQQRELAVKEIINQKQQIEEFQINYSKDSSEKILKRISDYSKLFSDQNSYKIIIGSQNKGDVIYGNETRDVTNDLLAFINKKYEGLN